MKAWLPNIFPIKIFRIPPFISLYLPKKKAHELSRGRTRFKKRSAEGKGRKGKFEKRSLNLAEA